MILYITHTNVKYITRKQIANSETGIIGYCELKCQLYIDVNQNYEILEKLTKRIHWPPNGYISDYI